MSKKNKADAAQNSLDGRVMYLGPNRAYDLPLMYNNIFTGNTLPGPVAEAVALVPQLKECFVPVATLGKSLANLKKPDSDLAKAVAKVVRETAAMRAEGLTLAALKAKKAENPQPSPAQPQPDEGGN